MNTLQARVMTFIFIGFAIASVGLAIAVIRSTASGSGGDVSPERDLVAVLENVAGEKLESRTDPSGQLLAVTEGSGPGASNSAASSPESDLPLPEDSYLTDFELDVDAFSFRNYGSSFPEGNLSITEIYEIFGEGVCLSVEGDTCVPSPGAQIWIDQMNDVMAQGHCLGFTVLAYDLFRKNISPERFQSQADETFGLPQGTAVMRTIAQRWSLQTTTELLGATEMGTPRDIVAKLYKLREPVDLGIFGRKGGGHSMLAYGVENQGEGLYHILVYDNNWPDQKAFVEVDTTKNTWQYALSGENPAEVPAIWEGDKDTGTLIFIPLSAYDQPVTCPFCPEVASASAKPGLAMLQPATATSNFVMVAMKGEEGQLQVSTPEGGRLGSFENGLVNDVDGALAVKPRSALYNNNEPILFVPGGQPFSVQILPREGVVNGSTSLRIFRPGATVAFDNLAIIPGQSNQITFSADGQQIGYIAGGGQSPTVQLAFAGGDANYLAVLSGMDLQGAQTLGLTVDGQGGGLTVESSGGDAQQAVLVISKSDSTGSSSQFASNSLPLLGDGAVRLAVQEWQDNADLTITLDEGGDGVGEQTSSLTDQSIADLLGATLNPAQMGAMLGELGVYLDSGESGQIQQRLLEALADGSLSGSQAGQLLFDLGNLGMDTPGLAAFIQAADLPVEQSAQLLFNLAVDESQQAEIIDTAFPTEAEKNALAEQLTRLDVARNLVSEFEFTQQPPSGFDSFIASQNVAPEVSALLAALPNNPNRSLSQGETVALGPQSGPETGAETGAAAASADSGSGSELPTTAPTAIQTATSEPPTDTPVASTATSVLPTDTPVPPTATPRPTNTPIPPTATPRPTNTPIPPTATPRPTNTPVPPTATPRPTNTPVPPTATPRPTNTPIPPTATPRPTNTPVPPTATPRPTNTPVPPTATPRPTNTPVPPTATPRPTNTPVPPTATPVPPTDTPVPPTNTPVPPTNTPVPPTNTPVPPTNTPVPPTNTPVPPTNTPVPPTDTPVPPTNTPVPPTNTPVPPTNTPVPPTATFTPLPPEPTATPLQPSPTPIIEIPTP